MSGRLHLWSVGPVFVCVVTEPSGEMARRLWAGLADRPSVEDVLEVLTSRGLAAAPAFVLASAEHDGVRVLIRGDLEAVAHGIDGTTLALSAGRSTTWHDDVVTDIASISVDLDGGRVEWLAPSLSATPGPSPASARPAEASGDAPSSVAEPAVAPEAEPVVEAVEEPEDTEPVEDVEDVDDADVEVEEPDDVAEPDVVAEELAPPPDGHTLDEAEFHRVSSAEGASVAPEGDGADAEVPPPSAADGLDFSGLLEGTSHRSEPTGPAPAPPSAPPTPAPPTPAPPPPSPAASPPPERPAPAPSTDPPAGAEPPLPTARQPIAGVPPAGATRTPAAPGPDPSTGLGEHDGRTTTLAELRRLQREAGSTPSPPAAVPVTGPHDVRAVRCPAGHPNPPAAATCRRCDADIVDTDVVSVPRPVVARLVFDSGLVVDVDRPQLIGRRPTTPPEADEIPNLVTVPSPESDISRVHTAVRVEGWDVLVEDAGSTNGTEVRLPNREPVRLREHDPMLVVVGTEVTMAGAVRFRIEAAGESWG